jgi:hypothetical protein
MKQNCPGCAQDVEGIQTKVAGVVFCPICEAVFGTCYRGESYLFVLPYMDNADASMDNARYYDFTTIGSEGLERRHGWYNPANRLVLQFG